MVRRLSSLEFIQMLADKCYTGEEDAGASTKERKARGQVVSDYMFLSDTHKLDHE